MWANGLRTVVRPLARPRAFATQVTLKNLPFNVTSQAVVELLTIEGLEAPSKVEVALTGAGKPKGWAYATFAGVAEADLAVEALKGKAVEGRPIKAYKRGEALAGGAPPGTPVQAKAVKRVPGTAATPEDEDTFTTLRAAMVADEDRTAADVQLQLILKDLYKVGEGDEGSLDEMVAAAKRAGALERGEGAGMDLEEGEKVAPMSPEEASKAQAAAEEAALEAARLSKARADPLAFSEEGSHSTDQLPGQWVETIVAVDRVQKIITGGSIMSYRVLVVVGNAMGAGGYGVGKALDPAAATARAIRAAKKSLVVVDRFKMTGLVHSVEGQHNSCRVILRAVPPGYGMKGSRIATAILTSMGIGDCTAKAVGRRTPFAVVRAMFKALARHTSLSEVSRSRGRRIIEMEWRRGV